MVTWKTNIHKDHAIKINMYYKLTNKLNMNRFLINLYILVEEGGITANPLYNLLEDLCQSRTNIN